MQSRNQDLSEGRFDKAVENIREFRGEGKNMISMIELLLAQIVMSSVNVDEVRGQLKQTITKLLEAQKSDSSADFPEEVSDNLEWLRQLVFQDLAGEETFDGLLDHIDNNGSEICLRAVLKDKIGIVMVEEVREMNKGLQSRATKAMEIHNVKEKLTDDNMLQVIAETANLNITALDLGMPVLAGDYNDICKKFVEQYSSLCVCCQKELETAYNDVKGEAIIMSSMQNFLASDDCRHFLEFHSHYSQLHGKLILNDILASCKINPLVMGCLFRVATRPTPQ